MNYIFNVNNVLLPSNESIDGSFKSWFQNWIKSGNKNVYICTNNTYENISYRLGRTIVETCKAVFSSGGNQVNIGSRSVIVNTWRPPSDLTDFLGKVLEESQYKIRSGPNIEYRVGMISFSIPGKTLNDEQRLKYAQWDKTTKERKKILDKIKSEFPNIDAIITGTTSIDICNAGNNKSQILKYLDKNERTYIFGESKKLAEGVYNNKFTRYNIHTVKSWQETHSILKSL